MCKPRLGEIYEKFLDMYLHYVSNDNANTELKNIMFDNVQHRPRLR